MSGKRGINYFFASIFLIIMLVLAVGWFLLVKNTPELRFSYIPTCGDGTNYGDCSENKPYYCDNGVLSTNAYFCQCPEELNLDENSCVSEYQLGNNKTLELEYFLRGEKGIIKYVVYEDLYSHLSKISRAIITDVGEIPTLTDFKVKNIENKEQRALLLPLVIEIQNLAPNSKEDQARIAISLVQHLDYGFSENNISLEYGMLITDTRYPYETLYDEEGLCGEKSELLAFLLKEIGYDVILFRYLQQNHEVVGIRCPKKYSIYGSEYCFVESTRPSIITDNTGEYLGVGHLITKPVILVINEGGDSLGKDMQEYDDAKEWSLLIEDIENSNGKISNGKYQRWKELIAEYGLEPPKYIIDAVEKNRN